MPRAVLTAAARDPRGVYPRLAVVALLRDRRGRWLLVRTCHDPSRWAPVGGRVESGETLAGALRRELQEEVGLEACILAPCYAALVNHKSEATLAVSLAASLAATTLSDAIVEGLAVGEKTPGDERVSKGLDGEVLDGEVLDVAWFTRVEWVELARRGRTPWRAADVLRGTLLADTLIDSPAAAQDLTGEGGG